MDMPVLATVLTLLCSTYPTPWCNCYYSFLVYPALGPTTTTSNPGTCCAPTTITAPTPTQGFVTPLATVSSVPTSDPGGLLCNLASAEEWDFSASSLWPDANLALTYAACEYSTCTDLVFTTAKGPSTNKAGTNILATTTIIF